MTEAEIAEFKKQKQLEDEIARQFDAGDE
jgi:hypothetical protein